MPVDASGEDRGGESQTVQWAPNRNSEFRALTVGGVPTEALCPHPKSSETFRLRRRLLAQLCLQLRVRRVPPR
eukprot:8972677-Alexandrium_andersonii.AAC.1